MIFFFFSPFSPCSVLRQRTEHFNETPVVFISLWSPCVLSSLHIGQLDEGLHIFPPVLKTVACPPWINNIAVETSEEKGRANKGMKENAYINSNDTGLIYPLNYTDSWLC